MDVNTVNLNGSNTATSYQTGTNANPAVKLPVAALGQESGAMVKTTGSGEKIDTKQEDAYKNISKEDLSNVTSELNKLLQLMNPDIQFAIHERTKQLMVQVVSVKDKQIIREFPSHELLDTIANIRDYVGVLLDKKA